MIPPLMIDVSAHIRPRRFNVALQKYTGHDFGFPNIPSLSDLEARFRVMDRYPGLVQVLTIVAAGIQDIPMGHPRYGAELARIANDEMAELVHRHPDRFVGAMATLPTANMEETLREVDRAIGELKLQGVVIHSRIDGRPLDAPEFLPLYEKMAQYDLPIWLHPIRTATPDYEGEERSRYWIWSLWGWPYETTLALTRLVYSGVFDRYPGLKVITHHGGAMVPFFAERIVNMYEQARKRSEDMGSLARPPLEYFGRFYADTALNGSTPALMCAHAFFGTQRLLFGTDMPHDIEQGHKSISQTIRSVLDMPIPEAEKKSIFQDNARLLFRLP